MENELKFKVIREVKGALTHEYSICEDCYKEGKIVVGHSCPICYSTHLSTHRYNNIVTVECDKCEWKGEFVPPCSPL